MNAIAEIRPDYFDRLLDTRAQAVEARNMLGQTMHGLNLAARRLEALGEDASIFRELVDQAKPVRWAR